MSTTLDRLEAATLALARPGSIKDRLTDAYRNHLAVLDEEDFPLELVAEFRAITERLIREPPLLRGEDSFRATVRKISSGEATEIACAIVRLFGAAARQIHDRAPLKKSASAAVPLYLAKA